MGSLSLWPVLVGFLLDYILGEPKKLPRLGNLMKRMVVFLETHLRKWFPETEKGQVSAGALLTVIMCIVWLGITAELLFVFSLINPVIEFVIESWLCYEVLSIQWVKRKSIEIAETLKAGDIDKAQYYTSLLIEEDTRELTHDEIVKATVEKISTNAVAGAIAPMIFIAFGGAPLGLLYLAMVVTGSAIGYKSEEYRCFGRVPMQLNRIIQYIPMRLCANLIILAAFIKGYDYKKARFIYKRDKNCSKNSDEAYTKAACAGALQIGLGGYGFYQQKYPARLPIGDSIRKLSHFDIQRANTLIYLTAFLMLVFTLVFRWGVTYMLMMSAAKAAVDYWI